MDKLSLVSWENCRSANVVKLNTVGVLSFVCLSAEFGN